MKCTRLGCTNVATAVIKAPYGGRPWFGCPEHTGAMASALSIGQPLSNGVTVTSMRPRSVVA